VAAAARRFGTLNWGLLTRPNLWPRIGVFFIQQLADHLERLTMDQETTYPAPLDLKLHLQQRCKVGLLTDGLVCHLFRWFYFLNGRQLNRRMDVVQW
jgi:hypothetical protein